MPVVTMSGNIASGAREAGEVAATLLKLPFVDQQLMVEAAQRCGVTVGAVEERDERYGSFRERLSGLLRTFLERSVASGADPLTGATGLEAVLSQTYADMAYDDSQVQLSDDVYLKTMTALIRELGGRGDIVLLGRGSQMILKDLPDALHVLCIAPGELRAQRLADRDEMTLDAATRRMVESDRARCAFYKKFWKVSVDDPRLYDLTIDTSRLSYEAAAELIASAARLKLAVPAGAPN